MTLNIKITVLWNVTPCCLAYNCCFHLQGTKVNMEAAGSSAMLLLTEQTTWNHIPEDCNIQQYEKKSNVKRTYINSIHIA